jgi:2-hydroxychromene-2-carboxylate isomerase
MRRLQFWFEFASTYSYVAALRIERVAGEAGVTVEWKPFLLGPIFQGQGWNDSPFNIYPAKGRYM